MTPRFLLMAFLIGMATACSDGQGDLVERVERSSESQPQVAQGQQGLPPGHPMLGGGQAPDRSTLAPPGPPLEPPQIQDGRAFVAGLSFQIDPAWESAPPTGLRAAQFRLPPAEGDPNRNELVLFHGIGGPPQMNLERWIGQVTQPDGSPSSNAATMEEFQVDGMSVYTLDVSGVFADPVSPTMGAGEPQEGFRLLGAIIEGPGGPWQFKMVGPEATIANAKESFNVMIQSIAPAQPAVGQAQQPYQPQQYE